AGRHTVDAALPLADQLLRGRVFLELPGRWRVWIPDQPAGVALLPAGPQHDAGACAHRALRRLWAAVAGAHADRRPPAHTGRGLARASAGLWLLGDEHRARADGRTEPAADRAGAGVGQHRAGSLVRTE